MGNFRHPFRRRLVLAAMCVPLVAIAFTACETKGDPCTGILKDRALRGVEANIQAEFADQDVWNSFSAGDQHARAVWLQWLFWQPRYQDGDTGEDSNGRPLVCEGTWKLAHPGSTDSTTTTTTTVAGPKLSGITPSLGYTYGGTSVTLTGTGLADTLSVTFGGVAGTSVQVVSPTEVTVVAPAGTGTVDVAVTTAAGTATLAEAFTYSHCPFSITGDGSTPVVTTGC